MSTTSTIIGAGAGAGVGALAGGVGGAVQGAAGALGMNPIGMAGTLFLTWLDDIFGWSRKAFVSQINQRAQICSDPTTWNPALCGPYVWGATRCYDGSIAPHGGSCPCKLSEILFPQGCSRLNALKDNWLTLAAIGMVMIVVSRNG
jgi:hypothetical protein